MRQRLHFYPVFLLFVLLSLNAEAQIAPVAPEPPLNMRWIINEDYTDEFNGGELDLNKWYDYHPRWVGRSPAIFLPSQVGVADGKLRIQNAKLARDTVVTLFNGEQVTYSIGGGAVVSRKITAHYGYYEVNMRASKIKMSSTFWFSNPSTSGPCPTFSTELDVIEAIGGSTENPSFATSMKSNSHYFERACNDTRESNSRGGQTPVGSNVADAFHRYGVWWKNGQEIEFYLDGEKRHSITRPSGKPLEREMHLNMVTETYDWQPPPTAAALADDSRNTTYYDYVRGMQLIGIDEEAPSDVVEPGTNLVTNGGFESGDFTGWIGWGGNPREVVQGNQAAGSYACRIVGGGAPEQVIAVTPNTEYTMSCQAKVVTGQVSFGVKPTESNEAIANLIITDTAYTTHSLTFNSGDLSEVKIYFFAMAGGNEAFGDEFSLVSNAEPVEPDPVEYEQFPVAVAFNTLPQIGSADTNIPAEILYQAPTDHDLILILREESGTEISRKTLSAKAGYGHRAEVFQLNAPFPGGTILLLEAELRPPGGPDGNPEALGRIQIEINGTTTSNRNLQLAPPSISPNPASDVLVIRNIKGDALPYRIYDFMGRNVQTGVLPIDQPLNVQTLRAGAYLLAVENHAAVRFIKR